MSEERPHEDADQHTAPIDGSEEARAGAPEARPRRSLFPRKRERTRSARAEAPAPAGSDAAAAAPAPETSAEDAAPKKRRGLLPKRRQPGRAARREGPAGGSDPVHRDADEAPSAETSERRQKRARARRGDRPAPASALRRERKALLDSRQDAVFHLGGLAFEMYRRELLAEGIVKERAAQIASLDERIRTIDQQLGDRASRRGAAAAATAGPAGQCLVCRAPFPAEARFCSSCGARFAPELDPTEQETGAIDPVRP